MHIRLTDNSPTAQDVMNDLLDAGFQVEYLEEGAVCVWRCGKQTITVEDVRAALTNTHRLELTAEGDKQVLIWKS